LAFLFLTGAIFIISEQLEGVIKGEILHIQINWALVLRTKRYSGGITVWEWEQEQETDECLHVIPEDMAKGKRETCIC
jgi:hypothetical protein